MLMSPELREIFDRHMQPTRMHVLLAVEWHNVEDAVEACIGDLEAERIGKDDIKAFMQSRFCHLEGLQNALVIGNATMRARSCFFELQRLKEFA